MAGNSVQLTLTHDEWDIVRDLVRGRDTFLATKLEGVRLVPGGPTPETPGLREFGAVRVLAAKVETIEAARMAADGAMSMRNYTAEEAALVLDGANQAIALYRQFLAEVPEDEELARAKALLEIGEGLAVDIERITAELLADGLARRAVPADADDSELPL